RPILEQIRIYRQRMAGVGCWHKCPPSDWSQAELLHHTSNALGVNGKTAAIQLHDHTTIAIPGEFLVHTFYLLSQFLVLGIATLPLAPIGFVVKRAGGKTGYLARF